MGNKSDIYSKSENIWSDACLNTASFFFLKYIGCKMSIELMSEGYLIYTDFQEIVWYFIYSFIHINKWFQVYIRIIVYIYIYREREINNLYYCYYS